MTDKKIVNSQKTKVNKSDAKPSKFSRNSVKQRSGGSNNLYCPQELNHSNGVYMFPQWDDGGYNIKVLWTPSSKKIIIYARSFPSEVEEFAAAYARLTAENKNVDPDERWIPVQTIHYSDIWLGSDYNCNRHNLYPGGPTILIRNQEKQYIWIHPNAVSILPIPPDETIMELKTIHMLQGGGSNSFLITDKYIYVLDAEGIETKMARINKKDWKAYKTDESEEWEEWWQAIVWNSDIPIPHTRILYTEELLNTEGELRGRWAQESGLLFNQQQTKEISVEDARRGFLAEQVNLTGIEFVLKRLQTMKSLQYKDVDLSNDISWLQQSYRSKKSGGGSPKVSNILHANLELVVTLKLTREYFTEEAMQVRIVSVPKWTTKVKSIVKDSLSYTGLKPLSYHFQNSVVHVLVRVKDISLMWPYNSKSKTKYSLLHKIRETLKDTYGEMAADGWQEGDILLSDTSELGIEFIKAVPLKTATTKRVLRQDHM
jgi:hypothetical protein